MITDRESMGTELQRILDAKTNPWGITVQAVEIRDVRIPQALEDAMSREAQGIHGDCAVVRGRDDGLGGNIALASIAGAKPQ